MSGAGAGGLWNTSQPERAPKTPESIQSHAPDYEASAWRKYSWEELGQWVCLLMKRAGHRTTTEKKTKDLHDAQNYLNMLQSHLDNEKAKAGINE